VLTNGVFKFGEPEFHPQDFRLEGRPETVRLLCRVPVGKVGQGARGVFDHRIGRSILQPARPSENALDARRVRRHYANGSEANARRCHIVIHQIEPIGGDLARSGSHIGKNDRSTTFQMIDESVETGGSMDIDLGDRAIEEMLERAACPVDDRAKWATFQAQQDAATRDAEAVAEQQRAQEQAKDRQVGALPMADKPLDSLYFDYKLSGDPAYRPKRVLDDGQHTYLIFPSDGRFRELPTLLMLVKGKTELVNFRVDGTRYIVDRLFDKAILVVGVGKKQTRVTITRATPYSGTTGKRS